MLRPDTARPACWYRAASRSRNTQLPPRPRSRPHVGIYLGGGRFIHAPHTGDHVRVSSLAGVWYAEHYDGATRVA
jgi:cell wall-associated NlpC family hydrolase